MDFETYMLAVPEYDGHWPYRQVPFQFSMHRQDIEGGNVKHDYFLAENDCNPCPQFVERLLACLVTKGSIIVYNKTFENCRLNELKNDYPEYVETITAIQARIIDLMVPFRKKFLYHPAMQGSYSIKKVLPALLPELSYNDLAISDGGNASATFYNLRYEPDVKKVATNRKDLLQYCKLDTWAMVKLVEKMREI